MSKATFFATIAALTATSASATVNITPVPEIDAVAGVAALAVVGAAVALIRERTKR